MSTLYGVKNADGTVSLFRDRELSNLKIRWAGSNPPDYRYRYVTLNCWRYRLEWVR